MPKRTRKYEKPPTLDLPFDEAVKRYAQADPKELDAEVGAASRSGRGKKGDMIEDLMIAFEDAAHHDDDGAEFWRARELYKLLGYASWERFQSPLKKAKEACAGVGEDADDHFHACVKMVSIGSGAKREQADVELTRFACYLIAQNGDPTQRPEIAAAQTYFAIQTRRQEIADGAAAVLSDDQKRVLLRDKLKEHNKALAEAAQSSGVTNFRNFNGAGLKGLYGGLNQSQVVRRKKLPQGSNHLDYAPHSELAANYFKATQAEEILRREGEIGQRAAEAVHKKVGQDIHDFIKGQGNTPPEDIQPEDHIKHARKRIASTSER